MKKRAEGAVPGPAREVRLEVDAEGYLSGAVAGVLCGLRGAEDAEGGGVVDLRSRWREVGVVEDVGEGGLEAELRALGERECLGES